MLNMKFFEQYGMLFYWIGKPKIIDKHNKKPNHYKVYIYLKHFWNFNKKNVCAYYIIELHIAHLIVSLACFSFQGGHYLL
jgi:hypothetical protein